jgi:alkylation response protein AidB-like acyl-CoA dehydrogenase
MDFDITDDQSQLREACARWVERAYAFPRRRTIVQEGGFSRQVWSELAELGLTSICVPEEHGGLSLGAVEAMLVMEQMGRGLVLEPLAQCFVATALLRQAPPDLAGSWLPAIASGEKVVVLAHQERQARYRLDECSTVASADGGQYTVTGAKSLVAAGAVADAFLVPAITDGSISLFLVERAAAGVGMRSYLTQDGSQGAEVRFDGSPARLVDAQGLDALELGVDIAIAALCAEGVGVMDVTLAATAEYLNTRKQFGVVIGSFQALRHRVADMKMQIELARSMSYYASLNLQSRAPQRRAALARAKYQLCNSMRFVGQQAVQLHGGIALTDEYIVSHYFKKLTQLEVSFGDGMFQLSEISSHMGADAGVFS